MHSVTVRMKTNSSRLMEFRALSRYHMDKSIRLERPWDGTPRRLSARGIRRPPYSVETPTGAGRSGFPMKFPACRISPKVPSLLWRRIQSPLVPDP